MNWLRYLFISSVTLLYCSLMTAFGYLLASVLQAWVYDVTIYDALFIESWKTSK